MRFGLALDFGARQGTLQQRIDLLLPVVEAAERYGFESIWAGESYPTQAAETHVPAPFLVLANLARSTSLKLGTGVILMPAHHPLRLAYETAMLDQLTGGRFILGVGAGGAALWKRFGIDRSIVADYVDEMLAALCALWSGADGFQGEHLRIDGGIAPLPATPGGPPIWVGGYVRRSAERAAAFGDAYYAGTSSRIERITRQVQRYREALAARGIDPSGASVALNRLTVVAETEDEARRIAGRYAGEILGRYARMGRFGQELPAAPRATDELFAELDADVCIVGTPDQVAERVRQYARLGVTHLECRLCPADIPPDLAIQTVRLLGERVIPLLA